MVFNGKSIMVQINQGDDMKDHNPSVTVITTGKMRSMLPLSMLIKVRITNIGFSNMDGNPDVVYNTANGMLHTWFKKPLRILCEGYSNFHFSTFIRTLKYNMK